MNNIITLDIYPQLNKPNKNGRVPDSKSFHEAMEDFIKNDVTKYITFDKDNNIDYIDCDLDTAVGHILNIIFDKNKNGYVANIVLFEGGTNSELINYCKTLNFEDYCLATISKGEPNDGITTYEKIHRLSLHHKRDIVNALVKIDEFINNIDYYNNL